MNTAVAGCYRGNGRNLVALLCYKKGSCRRADAAAATDAKTSIDASDHAAAAQPQPTSLATHMVSPLNKTLQRTKSALGFAAQAPRRGPSSEYLAEVETRRTHLTNMKKRNEKSARRLVNPDSSFMAVWDVFTTLALAYTALVTPIEVSSCALAHVGLAVMRGGRDSAPDSV